MQDIGLRRVWLLLGVEFDTPGNFWEVENPPSAVLNLRHKNLARRVARERGGAKQEEPRQLK